MAELVKNPDELFIVDYDLAAEAGLSDQSKASEWMEFLGEQLANTCTTKDISVEASVSLCASYLLITEMQFLEKMQGWNVAVDVQDSVDQAWMDERFAYY